MGDGNIDYQRAVYLWFITTISGYYYYNRKFSHRYTMLFHMQQTSIKSI